MWTCPTCHHQFYNTNQSHSCGLYTLDDFLTGKPPRGLALFDFFIKEYEKIGPFTLHPVKTRVALLAKMRFCAVNKIAQDHIGIHLVLRQPFYDSPYFYKIDNLADRFFVHHARLHVEGEITDEGFRQYMLLAYKVGNRAHIG